MDLRLVICFAVFAFAAVEATSVIGPKCAGHCEYGFYPGSCRCRKFPVQPTNPCAARFCPINTRCEARGTVAVCVPVPVNPIQPVDVCRQLKETGPCEAYMPRYYYNSLSRQCERFIYGGCLGNENNFHTRRECNSRCRRYNGYY